MFNEAWESLGGCLGAKALWTGLSFTAGRRRIFFPSTAETVSSKLAEPPQSSWGFVGWRRGCPVQRTLKTSFLVCVCEVGVFKLGAGSVLFRGLGQSTGCSDSPLGIAVVDRGI